MQRNTAETDVVKSLRQQPTGNVITQPNVWTYNPFRDAGYQASQQVDSSTSQQLNPLIDKSPLSDNIPSHTDNNAGVIKTKIKELLIGHGNMGSDNPQLIDQLLTQLIKVTFLL